MTFDEPDKYSWRVAIRLNELTQLLRSFVNNEPNTQTIELQAARLMKDNNFSESGLRDFVQAVCKWGGYVGIAARVLKKNETPDLLRRFKSAHNLARAGNDSEAIDSLLGLNGFGVSFASKHLKFLAPDHAIVLDSILRGRLETWPIGS
ncbi:MAG: hypothetical protein ACREFO_09560 [Acetobacteraceae bacterium]